jgi:hypothetical protein
MNRFDRLSSEIPRSFRDPKAWNLSRKAFIRSTMAAGLALNFPLHRGISGVVADDDKVLKKDQRLIMQNVQDILFPDDGNGPGAKDIHALEYLEWVLSDKEKDPDEIKYIINGIDWLNETAEEAYSQEFQELSRTQQEEIIAKISVERWGESWLSVILTFIFEALLCDPQYPANPDGIGWAWLNHDPGQPRPKEELLFPQVLNTLRNSD